MSDSLWKKARAFFEKGSDLSQQLESWSKILAWLGLSGLPMSALMAVLIGYWKATDTIMLVNIRWLVIGQLVLCACLAGLIIFSLRKEGEIERLNKMMPRETKDRAVFEDLILEVLWKHSGLGSIGIHKRFIPHESVQLIEYHLEELRLSKLVYQDIQDGWHLNQNGKKYVIDHNLHRPGGGYLRNSETDSA